MTNCLRHGHRGSLEYSFTSNFIWRKIFKLHVAEAGGYAIVLSDPEDPSFIFPLGSGALPPVLEALMRWTKARGKPLVFNTLLEDDKIRLEALYPNQFEFTPIRDAYDYIYETSRLDKLPGKKLANKRNGINKFLMENRDWRFEVITQDNIADAQAMSQVWCEQAGCRDNPSLYDESCAVEQAFRHFFDLGLDGGLLRVGQRVVAFSMGDALTEDVYLAHIEKAFDDIPGAYQMINQQFVRHFALNYKFVNREDDTGDEGLRKAKLSYEPVYLVAKYRAVHKG